MKNQLKIHFKVDSFLRVSKPKIKQNYLFKKYLYCEYTARSGMRKTELQTE